jgi:hypothetical protein
MCVYSMVMDHYKDRFAPWDTWTNPPIPYRPQVSPQPPEDFKEQLDRLLNPKPSPEVEALRELIKEFREALAAAKLVDVLTDQPDCEDPVKAKLEDRVKALEKHLGL